MKLSIVVALAVVASARAACGPSGFKATGSDTVYPVALAWVPGYQKQCPAAKPITVTAGGSSQGIKDVCAGTSDIGMSSRAFKDTEATGGTNGAYTCVSGGKKLTQVAVASDGIVVIAKTGGNAAKCIAALVSPAQTVILQAGWILLCWVEQS
jgi:ABC-type phosphate transport system substrate-binding protein